MENDVLLTPSTYSVSPISPNVQIHNSSVPVTPEYNVIQDTNSCDYPCEETSSNIDYIGIGLAIFIIIIIIISLIIYFISLTSLGTSRAGLIDDEHTDPAYNRGSYAILAAIVAFALVASSIVLFYYLDSVTIFLIVLVFISFLLAIISGAFGVYSSSAMRDIVDPDDEIRSAINFMGYAYIAIFVAAFFLLLLFIYTIIQYEE